MMSAAYRETAMNLLEQDIGILRLESSKCVRGKRDECPLGQREWLLALCWVSSMLGRLELTAKRHVFNKAAGVGGCCGSRTCTLTRLLTKGFWKGNPWSAT